MRYLTGCGLARFILFPAPGMAPVPQADGGEYLELPGQRIVRGYLVPPTGASGSNQPPSLIVFFHGNGATMDGDLDLALLFAKKGMTSLLVEYPGYGLSSDSRPSEEAIYEDAEILIRHVQQRHAIEAERTVMFGHSLGAGVAVEMTARGLARKSVLISPFTSVPDVAGVHFLPALLNWLPGLILCDRFDSRTKSKGIATPVMIIHGREDTIIPFFMGEELSRTFPDVLMVAVDDANHNDIFRWMSELQWQMLFEFIVP